MKTIQISCSTYGKAGRRLLVEYDDNGYGSGTRITGQKFSYFPSTQEITVPLTVEESKKLIAELNSLIVMVESGGIK